jgi:hypothetical protein
VGSSSISGSTVREGGSRAAYLTPTDLDGDEGGDAMDWTEGTAWWTGVPVDQVEEVREGVKALEGLILGGKLRVDEVQVKSHNCPYAQRVETANPSSRRN